MLSDKEIKELKSKLNDYETKISKMKRDISYSEYEYRTIEGKISNYARDISSNTNSISSCERDIREYKNEANKLFQKAKEWMHQADLADNNLSYKMFKSSAENCEREANQYLRKANLISSDISRLESDNRMLNNQKFDEERKLKDLKKYLEDSEKALKKLDKERYDFKVSNKL